MSESRYAVSEFANLEEVRATIDRLDREIVKPLAECGKYVVHAARFKHTKADIHVPAGLKRWSRMCETTASNTVRPPK